MIKGLASEGRMRGFYSLEKNKKVNRTYKLSPMTLQCLKEIADIKDWSQAGTVAEAIHSLHFYMLESGQFARLRAWKERLAVVNEDEEEEQPVMDASSQPEQEPVVENKPNASKSESEWW